jgi:hypothetical protein
MGMPCRNPAIARTPDSAVHGGAAPDSMRHGGFYWEVVGDDRATVNGTRRDASDVLARTLTNPCTNQAGALAPRTSADGQALHAAAGGTFIREMNPVEHGYGFRNNVGHNRARSAHNITVVADFGYDGILPLTQQPHINKPLPY